MFTIQQIQEIARRLTSMSKKDSDFKPLSTWKSLSRQDYIALVKNGSNRSVTIDQLYTYVRQNINSDIGDALDRIAVLESAVQELSTTLDVFIEKTNTHLTTIDNSIEGINKVLNKLTTKYTITVTPVTPNATVFINGVRQNTMKVTSGSTVNVKVSAEGYDTYEEFILVEGDITLSPELNQSLVTFTIAANPSDSVVRLNGVERKAIAVPKGTMVNWEVSKAGYITKSGSETVETSYTLPVILEAIGSDEANFTVNVVSPSNATVTINGVQGNTVVVKKGSQVTWSVEAPYYVSQNGNETVNEDTVKNITLVAEQFTLTINPTPSDANVELNGVSQKSVTVDYGTKVHIKVSKEGYETYESDYNVTNTETKDVTLIQIVETSWDTLTLAQADASENPITSVPAVGGNITIKAGVIVHFSDGSVGFKDVTHQMQWSVEGTGCSSKGFPGVFSWNENTETSSRSATISASVTGPDSSTLSETIQTTQLGNEYLDVTPNTLEYESTGGSKQVQVRANVSWEAF